MTPHRYLIDLDLWADSIVMCSKGHDHSLIRSDLTSWIKLKLIGVQIIEADDTGPEERLELRDCECGSTLARKISRECFQ